MLMLWLIVCGDVEINPGPADKSVKGHLSIFLLNIRSVRNTLNALTLQPTTTLYVLQKLT